MARFDDDTPQSCESPPSRSNRGLRDILGYGFWVSVVLVVPAIAFLIFAHDAWLHWPAYVMIPIVVVLCVRFMVIPWLRSESRGKPWWW